MSAIKSRPVACTIEKKKYAIKQLLSQAFILHNHLPYSGCILSARQLSGGRTLMADALTAIYLPEYS